MNQQLIITKNYLLILLSLISLNSFAFSETIQVNWLDNSSNEQGFVVEKRLFEDDTFEHVSTLPKNSTNFTDADVIANQKYCYRITAFNDAGESISDESCIVLSEPTKPSEDALISHQFITKPFNIEVGDKEFYSFKSGITYNEFYSDDEIYSVDFLVNKGKIRNKSRRFFKFKREGAELENGFKRIKFNTENSLSFILQGHGSKQVATLYMKARAKGDAESSIIVTAGDRVEKITLPNGQRGHFLSIDIEFYDSAPVTITTDSNRKGGLMFAGMVFDKAN